jgi:hypothetical protein
VVQANSQERGVVLSFLENFFQERNIRWTLALGMMILLASSVMLVTSEWERYPQSFKHLILLAYTAAIFLGGEWSQRRLALPQTGSVLMAMTVLLLPITLAGLRFVQSADGLIAAAGLGGVNLAFAAAAARRVFRHFLRDTQPTFLASYLILAAAGAVLPNFGAAWAPWLSLLLWLVFTAGTVKVNRHVFWLTEECRRPRVFGFFPVALLGAQFLTLFLLDLAPRIRLEWLGLGCVLVALPVLMTADAVARVFQQRTGDLVRPLPWSIVAPLGVGLLLCTAGVLLAASGIPAAGRAFVPTAALAAGLMVLVAWRTQKRPFVWAALAGLILAYNFAPTYFIDLARQVVDLGAEQVREPSLPYAFYGLTYLPLIAAFTGWATVAARRSSHLFAQPVRVCSVGLAGVLLVLACTHAKAMFPVGCVMVAMFAAQAVAFRTRELTVAAIASLLIAAWGVTPFVTGVLGRPIADDARLWCILAAAALLLTPGRWADRLARRLPCSGSAASPSWWDDVTARVCEHASVIVTFALAIAWLTLSGLGLMHPSLWTVGAAIGGLLAVHALHTARARSVDGIGLVTVVYATVIVASGAAKVGLTMGESISLVTAWLVSLWLLTYLFDLRARWRVSAAFGAASRIVSTVGLGGALVCVCLPLFAAYITGLGRYGPAGPHWWAHLLVVAWAFDAARRFRSVVWGAGAAISFFAILGAVWATHVGAAAQPWLPAIWASVAAAAIVALEWTERRRGAPPAGEPNQPEASAIGVLLRPFRTVAFVVLGLTALGSLAVFTNPMRGAGAIALAGLLLWAKLRRQSCLRWTALVLANWQVLFLPIPLLCPSLETIFGFPRVNTLPLTLPLAFMASASLLVWQRVRVDVHEFSYELIGMQRWLLAALAGVAMCCSVLRAELDPFDFLLAVGSFLLLILVQIHIACRTQDPARVWAAEVIAALAVAYLVYFRVIACGRGVSMFAVLAAGLCLWLLSRWARRRTATSIMAGPFEQTATLLPLVTVGIGVYRHVAYAAPTWLGLNSLAILLAAGFYFWRAVEVRDKRWLVLAAAIMNVALALLWRELKWSDPQFYMIPIGTTVLALVQLLKAELPAGSHDALRYAGALAILTSPTSHIVEGSWLHMLTLMLASVALVQVAIGLRVRALVYTGAAFLAADLAAMLVRGAVGNPHYLWIVGMLLGGAVVVLGAVCEEHRERLLQRLRLVAAELQSWE